MNMGGPRNLDEVEVFLINMFNDKNILSIPSDLIRSFVAKMIVWSRANSAKHHYELIGGKSPLYDISIELAKKLEYRLDIPVFVQMRYTPPFTTDILPLLKQANIKEVVLLPMYPQYSTTTTKSSFEEFEDRAKKDFKITKINRYYSNYKYNNLIISKIKETIGDSNPKDFDIIFSAHGLPQKVINRGDPYQREVRQNLFILRKLLKLNGISFRATHLAYQSKVGPLKWIEPSLEWKLRSIVERNKKVIIYPIAFTIANLETDYELLIEYKEVANDLGFTDYRVCNMPNSGEDFCDAIIDILRVNSAI
jgi:ferrochelatase